MNDLTTAFVTLFVTVDPVGLAPLFLALTAGMTAAQRRLVALRAIMISAPVLAVFVIAGTAILKTFGITLNAFQVAGGLLLFYIAFQMIFDKRTERQMESAQKLISADDIRNVAIFPLAIPLLAGPGAISAIILLSSKFHSITGRLELLGICAAILVVSYAVLLAATRVDRFLGDTGRIVLTRLLGVLLAALSVQFVADGVLGFANVAATAIEHAPN